MAFVVLYDASVLFPTVMRDLLIRVAQSGLVQAKWTEAILDEMFAALQRQRPDLDPGKLSRTRALMATAVRDWKISGYEDLTDSLKLPDPDDRHVLAAAIRAHAQIVVTSNLRDFPTSALRPFGIEPKSPDEFMRDQIGLDRGVVIAAIQQIADSWRNPPGTFADVLVRLERSGLALSVAELRTSLPG